MKRLRMTIVHATCVLALAAGVAACTFKNQGQVVEYVELKYTVSQPDAWRVIDAFLAERGLREDRPAPPQDEGKYVWYYATPDGERMQVRIESGTPMRCFSLQISVPESSQDYRGARELSAALAELARRESWKLESNGACMG